MTFPFEWLLDFSVSRPGFSRTGQSIGERLIQRAIMDTEAINNMDKVNLIFY